jgi:hypothetical protein
MSPRAVKLLLFVALVLAIAAVCGGWKWNGSGSNTAVPGAYGWTWDGVQPSAVGD